MAERSFDPLGCLGKSIFAAFGILLLAPLFSFPSLGPRVSRDAQIGATRTQMDQFREPLRRYIADNGRPPTTAQGLRALIERTTIPPAPRCWRGSYFPEISDIPKDAWGNDYLYQSPGPRGEPYVITSLGHDGRPDGNGYNADISSTQVSGSRRRAL